MLIHGVVVVVVDGAEVLVDGSVELGAGRLVDRLLVDEDAVVVMTRGVVVALVFDEVTGLRSEEREALLCAPRESDGSAAEAPAFWEVPEDSDADSAFAGAGAWLCGSIRASTGTAVSPPIHSSTNWAAVASCPAGRPCVGAGRALGHRRRGWSR